MLRAVHGCSWQISGSCGLCTPLQSKTILNRRVLGYGRLNGHVASIVSRFSKRMFWKGTGNYKVTKRRNWYLRDTDDEKLQEILQRKTFLKQRLPKPFGYVISKGETILF